MDINYTKKHLDALDTIKRKLRGRTLTYKEIYNLMDEISSGRLSDVLTAYFVASGFKDGFSYDELYYLTKAMVETGEQLHFKGIVADKHSIGGLSGTRATMIVVPIVVSAGFIMPKTSSRAITSPAGTADVMETIANVNFTPPQIEKIINEAGGCIVWGGHLGIAPADDILIRVEEPLSFESFDKIIVSIMAKKVAVSTNHLVIDIPVGRTMKVKYEKDAVLVGDKFKEVAKRFGIDILIDINHTSQPAGNGIGPYLEAIDVMQVLEQHKNRPIELEERSLRLAAMLLNLCFKSKSIQKDGYEEAKQLLQSGKALETFRKIIKAQQGNPDITADKMINKAHQKEIKSTQSGIIKSINNFNISAISKILGAPKDIHAGLFMLKRIGDSVSHNEPLMHCYSSTEVKLKEAIDTLPFFPIYNIK